MTKSPLTDKQRSVFEFIEMQMTDHGNAPTIREIGAKFGISSTNGVRGHLSALIRKGYLKKHASISRGIELTRELAGRMGRVPLVGAVPAGFPIDSAENIEGEIVIDLSFLPKGDSYSLRVTGDSMKNAGILDGDLVLVKKQTVAQKGDIIVALVNEEATVKRYFSDGTTIRLQPENDDYEPIFINKMSGEFRIAGKVVGLIRKIG
ncbi:MAG: transcriptional repressor LexA [candidate division Zixibacteria bacterium]|nr:transcriptional repressor LexA [candidate division Zixibacteria bacterium]